MNTYIFRNIAIFILITSASLLAAEPLIDIDFSHASSSKKTTRKGSFEGPLPKHTSVDFPAWNSSVVTAKKMSEDGRNFLRFDVKKLDTAVLFRLTGKKNTVPAYYKLQVTCRCPNEALNLHIRQIPRPYAKFTEVNTQKDDKWQSYTFQPHFQNTRDDYPAPTGYEKQFAGNCWTPPDLQSLGGTSARHLPGYYGMVKRLDECFGRIMDSLRSLKLLDNTIVVFTSDHGCHFKTRTSQYKQSCHDSSIRIPMAFTGPQFKQGGRLQEMVSLADIAPTLLDACEIAIPEGMDGRSLVPLLKRDEVTQQNWPKEAFIEYWNDGYIGFAIRTARWTYSIQCTTQGNLKQDDWEFTESHLYDNQADPWQQDNVINNNAYAAVAEDMYSRLQKRIIEAGNPSPKIISKERTINQGQRIIHPEEII